MEQKRNMIRIEREPVILTSKPKLVKVLTTLFSTDADRGLFKALCARIEACVRAKYHDLFEELMARNLLRPTRRGFSRCFTVRHAELSVVISRFYLFLQIMTKSNFKVLKKKEWKIATSSKYVLRLDVKLNKDRLDDKLLKKYPRVTEAGDEQLFENRCLIYRRGIGCDTAQGYYMLAKVEEIQKSFWKMILRLCIGEEENFMHEEPKPDDRFMEMERIHVGDVRIKHFFQKVELQEPTFSQVIVIYSFASNAISRTRDDPRGIHIKQFKDVPMADLELVLPEKKSPRLSWSEWIKLIFSGVTGVVLLSNNFFFSSKRHSSFVPLAFTILAAFVGYCFKVYFTFHINVLEYHRLISKSIYDKQSDSHLGTLLHLCTNVTNQETMETIVGYFVLLVLGTATKQEFALHCNYLMEREFQERCEFEYDDALDKLRAFELLDEVTQ
ncbi:hypothetical protein SELMODRAFT_127781 [Selaginella moellendorffii]|uniref:Uncharacterized protein n=1 Tax=Selaginella moellendorffii TaxID=88036 RepID=D8SYB8_SELML|nr:hypothetical protein SELMODRAFT_127781 [Selaginella moellendorffii]